MCTHEVQLSNDRLVVVTSTRSTVSLVNLIVCQKELGSLCDFSHGSLCGLGWEVELLIKWASRRDCQGEEERLGQGQVMVSDEQRSGKEDRRPVCSCTLIIFWRGLGKDSSVPDNCLRCRRILNLRAEGLSILFYLGRAKITAKKFRPECMQ